MQIITNIKTTGITTGKGCVVMAAAIKAERATGAFVFEDDDCF